MQNHYNYVFDEITRTYNFTTNNNVLYRVAFIRDETFSTISGKDFSNIFQIIVEKANDVVEPFDPKVSKTIENIIEKFFEKIENALVYVCDDYDKKAILRFEIFNRWYKNSKLKRSVMKIDKIIQFQDEGLLVDKIYTSFMFHKDNSEYEKLIEIYNKIEDALNDKDE